MHRMAAASFSESDLAGESHLASMRIESDLSTGGDRRKLQAPAGAEHWNRAREDFTHEIDLPQ